MAELHLDALVAMAPAAVLDTTEFADPWFRDFARVGASEAARWLTQGPSYFTDGEGITTEIDLTLPAAALSYALKGYLSDFSVPEDSRTDFEEYVRYRFCRGFWWVFHRSLGNLKSAREMKK